MEAFWWSILDTRNGMKTEEQISKMGLGGSLSDTKSLGFLSLGQKQEFAFVVFLGSINY